MKTWQKIRLNIIEANPELYREYCKSKGLKVIDTARQKIEDEGQVSLRWYRKQISNLSALSINLAKPSGAEVIEAITIPLRKLTSEDLIPKICKKKIIKTGDPVIDCLPMRDMPFRDLDDRILSCEELDELEEQEKQERK